jgi:hypothetical protein
MGKRLGRKPKLDAGQKRKIAELYAAGGNMADLAQEYEVGRPLSRGDQGRVPREVAARLIDIVWTTGQIEGYSCPSALGAEFG